MPFGTGGVFKKNEPTPKPLEKCLPLFPSRSHFPDLQGDSMKKALIATAFLAICTQGRAATLFVSSPKTAIVGDSVTVEVDVSLASGETLFAYQGDVLFPS